MLQYFMLTYACFCIVIAVVLPPKKWKVLSATLTIFLSNRKHAQPQEERRSQSLVSHVADPRTSQNSCSRPWRDGSSAAEK
jgi:hypothetical protein